MAVLHMLRSARPDTAILFLDTGYHFPEVYEYRDRMARQWNLDVINLRAQAPEPNGLYRTDPDRCCKIHKVEPLLRGLEDYDVWFTGLRREQSPTRANLQTREEQTLPSGHVIAKVSPLAFWTWKEVWAYLRVNEIEPLPLYAQGYPSIGCAPCTALPSDADNPRSGRWAGQKLECGIHTFGAK